MSLMGLVNWWGVKKAGEAQTMYPKTSLTLNMYLKTSHVPSMHPPVHNAGTLQEHLSATIQLLLTITLQAHVEVAFEMWRKWYWQSHWMQMLRLHVKCEWNVSGQNIGKTFCQSLKCSQHVNTHFHRTSPPVSIKADDNHEKQRVINISENPSELPSEEGSKGKEPEGEQPLKWIKPATSEEVKQPRPIKRTTRSQDETHCRVCCCWVWIDNRQLTVYSYTRVGWLGFCQNWLPTPQGKVGFATCQLTNLLSSLKDLWCSSVMFGGL